MDARHPRCGAGARATLRGEAARRRRGPARRDALCAPGLDGVGVGALVLWDPVLNGAAWYAQASAEHRVYARGLGAIRHGRPARAPAGCEELCGTTYARGTIAELARLRLAVPTGIPVQIHATTIAWHHPARID